MLRRIAARIGQSQNKRINVKDINRAIAIQVADLKGARGAGGAQQQARNDNQCIASHDTSSYAAPAAAGNDENASNLPGAQPPGEPRFFFPAVELRIAFKPRGRRFVFKA